MTDPCGGNVPGGEGCTCDPPFLMSLDSSLLDAWRKVEEMRKDYAVYMDDALTLHIERYEEWPPR